MLVPRPEWTDRSAGRSSRFHEEVIRCQWGFGPRSVVRNEKLLRLASIRTLGGPHLRVGARWGPFRLGAAICDASSLALARGRSRLDGAVGGFSFRAPPDSRSLRSFGSLRFVYAAVECAA